MVTTLEKVNAGEVIAMNALAGETKRYHESESSDSDKEQWYVTLSRQMIDTLEIVVVDP